MKLVFCPKCQDVVRLKQDRVKTCDCGNVSGQYTDELYAWYSGEGAMPLGFANSSFSMTLKIQPNDGLGQLFTAFVIPKVCSTFENKDETVKT